MEQCFFVKRTYSEQAIGKKSTVFVSGMLILAFMFFAIPVLWAIPEIQPKPLPDPGIPGFKFPESETTLNQWVFGDKKQEIYKHAWGIWTALTMDSGERVGSQPLMVFETWKTPGELVKETNHQSMYPRKRRLRLQPPHQLESQKIGCLSSDSIFVSVGYDPSAAFHAVSNKLFWASTLKRFLQYGYQDIPNFPVNAVTIKPVYKIIQTNYLPDGRYFELKVWPGPPSVPQGFDEPKWNSCIYVDIKNEGKGDGSIDYTCRKRTLQNTYNLKDFINVRITAEDASYMNKELALQKKAQAGDYVILVAMHVGTREMKRWTWQTFWWSANPDNPFLPSSNMIAGSRPSQLKGARRHYAMAAAYSMLEPAQPLYGGKNQGKSLYAYNPYLEALFSLNNTPPDFQQVRAIYNPEKPQKWEYNIFGIQTNCMACHNLAQYDPNVNYAGKNDGNPNRQRPYSADSYYSLGDTIFQGNLKLDFAWSIIGNLVLDK